MDYPYEDLRPETFQEFCQALITREFPGTQCLSSCATDGGRDATAFFEGQHGGEFLMFQVEIYQETVG